MFLLGHTEWIYFYKQEQDKNDMTLNDSISVKSLKENFFEGPCEIKVRRRRNVSLV